MTESPWTTRRHSGDVLITASCAADHLGELVDASRRRLAVIAIVLSQLAWSEGVIAAQTRWDSDAARAFCDDADALHGDLRSLVDAVELLRDDLLAIRSPAVTAPWMCG